jgi:hypothetical protein
MHGQAGQQQTWTRDSRTCGGGGDDAGESREQQSCRADRQAAGFAARKYLYCTTAACSLYNCVCESTGICSKQRLSLSINAPLCSGESGASPGAISSGKKDVCSEQRVDNRRIAQNNECQHDAQNNKRDGDEDGGPG